MELSPEQLLQIAKAIEDGGPNYWLIAGLMTIVGTCLSIIQMMVKQRFFKKQYQPVCNFPSEAIKPLQKMAEMQELVDEDGRPLLLFPKAEITRQHAAQTKIMIGIADSQKQTAFVMKEVVDELKELRRTR